MPTKGNSARFNNLSLYVKKECLKKCARPLSSYAAPMRCPVLTYALSGTDLG